MDCSILRILKGGLTKEEKARCNAFLRVQSRVMAAAREVLQLHGYVELSGGALFDVTGLARNPFAGFPIELDGPNECLLGSARLQLEALAAQLGRRCFTVTKTFGSESCEIGSNLAELTSLELENVFDDVLELFAFEKLVATAEELVKSVLSDVVEQNDDDLFRLGNDCSEIEALIRNPFVRLTYASALELASRGMKNVAKLRLDAEACDSILSYFNNTPVIITNFPAELSFFTSKRLLGRHETYSFELLLPRFGLLASGALREGDERKLRHQFGATSAARQLVALGHQRQAPVDRFVDLVTTGGAKHRGGLSVSMDRLLSFVLAPCERLSVSYEGLPSGMPPAGDRHESSAFRREE